MMPRQRIPKVLMALAGLAAAATATTQASAEEVNVYSYRQPELVEPLFAKFTEASGIAVNVVFLKTGMIERLQSEGSRSPADVVLTVDISRLNAIVEAGVTQSVQSDALEAAVPANLRDPDGHWFGLTARARIVYASKDRVADGDVTTYEDLASETWAGRLCTRSGTHPYNLALISALTLHHDEEFASGWLEGLKSNLARKPQGNDRAQVKAIHAGECDISLGNTYYMGLMMRNDEQKAWADSVRIVFPTFEGGGTHVNLSGVAMTKSAPNKANALALMEFLASAEGQEIYAEVNHEYPITPGVPTSQLVDSWGSFDFDSLDLIDIAKARPGSLRLVETVDFDG